MKPRTVTASRYVTSLREGGSLPAIVEADDDGLYVLKFRGAGQGTKALIAELVAGEVGRLAGLPVPEIVFIELSADLARTEPDPEIQGLIRNSGGLNLALDYLPGSVWFDAFVCNVDRTVRNTNMLMWHRRLWLIDHGAALYFHHAWNRHDGHALSPFKLIKDHVLLRLAGALREVDSEMRSVLSGERLESIVGLIPDEWLPEDPGFDGKAGQREAYLNFFERRLKSSDVFVEEAIRARAAYV
jgi:hypothetical protein